MGCTTGAKLLRPGSEFILFKNRDFRRTHYEDRIRLTDKSFGALGLETWDGENPENDVLSGYSIGFNAHLACCDSNVRTVEGGASYDKLVEAVVENCTTIEQATDCVRQLVQDQLFCSANMIIATATGVAALEVRDHHVEVEVQPVYVARANHHVCLGATPADDDTTTTQYRYQTAYEGLRTARQLGDIFPILRSHEPDQQHSVCNHSYLNTVYSYVVHWNEGQITLHVAQGRPCKAEYVEIPIVVGQKNDLSRYPTNRLVQP